MDFNRMRSVTRSMRGAPDLPASMLPLLESLIERVEAQDRRIAELEGDAADELAGLRATAGIR